MYDVQLATLFIASFLGSAAFSFQLIFISVDLYSLGWAGISLFYLSWMVPAGLILFPCFSALKRFRPGWFIPVIMVVEIAGFLAMYFSRDLAIGSPGWEPVVFGLTNAFVATGFWQLNHLALAGVTTASNRTKEVSFAKISFQVGGFIGSFLGGIGIAFSEDTIWFWISCVCLIVSTYGLALICPHVTTGSAPGKRGLVGAEGLLQTFLTYPRQYIGVCLEVGIELSSKFLFAVWLLASGAPSSYVASLYAVRIIASLIVAPFIQPLVVKQEGREFVLAACLGFSGWTMLLTASLESILSLGGAFLLGVASFLFVTGLESRWYARRSLSQILVREFVLTGNRIIWVPLLAWLIYSHPEVFVGLSMFFFILAAPYGLWLVGSIHEREI